MNNELLKQLERKIDILKDLMSKFSTESVLGFCASKVSLSYDASSIFKKTGLSSPYKQYLYLAGLTISTNQLETQSFSNKDLKVVNKLLEDIVQLYSRMFFPTKDELKSGIDKNWYEARKVSMPVFLNYFNTIALPYQEQLINRIINWFSLFSDFFQEKYGFRPEVLTEIYIYMGHFLQKDLDSLTLLVSQVEKERQFFIERIGKQDMPAEQSHQLIDIDIMKEFYNQLNLLFHLKISELEEKFGREAIQSFINVFAIERKERNFRYYTESNPIESSPIWKKSDEFLFCPFLKQVINGIYDFLYTKLEESDYKERFYKKRDKETERETIEIFKTIFKDTAYYYTSVFETNTSHNEHDLIISYKDQLMIIEIKASKIKEPFRDPDKAYVRIRRDFNSDSGIQKAYDQGLKLKELIINNEHTPLYSEDGTEVTVLHKRDYKKIYIISVTAENTGIIGLNLSFLLNKPEHEPFPWSCNLYDLDSIVNAFQHKGLEPDHFLKYLSIREKYHEKIFSSDELEVCGYFLSGGSFDEMMKNDFCIMTADMSDIFDKIYFEQHGIDLGYKEQIPQLFKFENPYIQQNTEPTQTPKKTKKKTKSIMAKNSRKNNRKQRK